MVILPVVISIWAMKVMLAVANTYQEWIEWARRGLPGSG